MHGATFPLDRRLMLMSEATHFMALEKHREPMFLAVRDFLQEDEHCPRPR